MTGRDGRSVGELLLDADHTARDLLIDAPDLDAAVVLRTWGEVVETAADLWAALPAPPAPAGVPDPGAGRSEVMAQLSVMTDALTRGLRRGPWPGPGVTEPRLQHVADTFARAAQLVHGHATRSLGNDTAVRADVDAARTRIIHTLYVTSHAVCLAVAAHVRHREQVQSARGRTSAAGTLAVARPVLARLDGFELVAGAYVARTFPAALNGEHREAVHTPRVGDALAGWDVHAHRALATNPSPGHLRLVAMTQELVLRHAAHILRAAAVTGAIDPVQHATRLERPLEESRVGWAAAATRWSDLAAPSPRPDAPALAAAAAEVRATLRALTVDGPGPASAAVVAGRADLPATVRHLATALSSSSDLAHLVLDVAGDRGVAFPARAVNALAVAASTTRAGGVVPGRPVGTVVAIRDITDNRSVPLPDQLRAVFVHDAEVLVGATARAAAAGTWLHGPGAAPRLDPAPPRSGGHPHQLATTPGGAGVPAGVGPRCER